MQTSRKRRQLNGHVVLSEEGREELEQAAVVTHHALAALRGGTNFEDSGTYIVLAAF